MALEALPAETTSTTTAFAPAPPPPPASAAMHPPPPPPSLPLPLASSPMPAATAAASMTRRSSPPPPPPSASRVFPTPSLLPRASGVPRGTPFECGGTHTHPLLSRTSLTRTFISPVLKEPRIATEGASSTQHEDAQMLSPTVPHVKQGKHQPLFDTSLFESAQPVFMGAPSPKKATQLLCSDKVEHSQEDLHPKVPSSPRRYPLIAASVTDKDVGLTDMAPVPVIETDQSAATHKASSGSPTSCVTSPKAATPPGVLSPRMSPRHAFSCEPSVDRHITRKMASSAATSSVAAVAQTTPTDTQTSASSSRRRGSAVDRVVAESDDDLMSPLVGATNNIDTFSMTDDQVPAEPLLSNLTDLSPFQATSSLLPFGHFDLVSNPLDDFAQPLTITTGEVAPPPPMPAKLLRKKKRSSRRGIGGHKKRRVRRKMHGRRGPSGCGTLRANILIHPNYNPNSPSTDFLDGNSSSSGNNTTTPTPHGYISSDTSRTPNIASSSSSSPEPSPYAQQQPLRKRQRTESHSAATHTSFLTNVPPFELGTPLLEMMATESSTNEERQQEVFLDDMPLDVMSHAFSWFYLEEVARILPVSKSIRDVGQAVLAHSRAFDDMGFPLDSKSALQALSRAGACRLRKLVLLTRGTDQNVICNLFTNSPTLRYVEIDSWMLTEPMVPMLAQTKLEVLNVSGPSVPRVVRALGMLTGLRALFLNLSIFSEKDECRLARATVRVIAGCPQLSVVGTSFSLLHCAKPSVRLPHVTRVILPSLSRLLGQVMPNLEELCVWYPHERGALSPAKFLDRLTPLKNLTTLHLCFAAIPHLKQLRDLFVHIEDHMPTLRTLVCSIDAPPMIGVAPFSLAIELARSCGAGAAAASAAAGGALFGPPRLSGTNSWTSFLSTDTRGGASAHAAAPPGTAAAALASGVMLCPKLTVHVDKIDNIVARVCQRAGIDCMQ